MKQRQHLALIAMLPLCLTPILAANAATKASNEAASGATKDTSVESATLADDGFSDRTTINVTGLPTPSTNKSFTEIDLTRADITQSASDRLEDVLSDVAGFQQFRRSDSRAANPTAQGATLRALGGNAASRTLVLLDGVPVTDPMFGSVPYAAISPDLLDNIAVTEGGGTGAFGAGAIAGTIAMESAPRNVLGTISGETMVDNRGETEMLATLAPKLGDGYAVLSGSWDRGQGYWTTPQSQQVPVSAKSAYSEYSINLRTVTPLTNDIELQTHMLLFNNFNTMRYIGANTEDRGEDASVRLVGRGTWKFDVLAYLQQRDYNSVVISSLSTIKPLMSLDSVSTPATGLGAKAELRPPVGEHQLLRLGADWRQDSGDVIENAYIPTKGVLSQHHHDGGKTDDAGLFVEDNYQLGPLSLTAGGRDDRWGVENGYIHCTSPANVTVNCSGVAGGNYPNRNGWEATGRGGAVLTVSHQLDFRASAYTGFRQPTLDEMYRSYMIPPVLFETNPNLVNEQLAGYEGGIDVTPLPGVHLSATGFYNRVNHAIANILIGTNLEERQNVDAISARGLELGANAAWAKFTLDASLALTHSIMIAPGESINGLLPSQTPKAAASVTLGWHPSPGWIFSGILRHVSTQYEDSQDTWVLPAATTLGAYVQVPIKDRVSLVFRAENLANVSVETRNWNGSLDIAEPRTLWFGIKIGR